MKKILFLALSLFPLALQAQLADSTVRLVKVKGAVNFRDLGGYRTADGRSVKWGKVYRSADISHLTDADLDTLNKRHIRTVIDFRGTAEAGQAPDKLLPQTNYLLCPAGSDSLPDMKKMARMIAGDSFLLEMYGSTRYLADRYKPFFQRLLALPEDQALLFHCTGGRDRTGIGAALLLSLLGVPREKIYEDFTASNIYLESVTRRWTAPMAQAAGVEESVVREKMKLRPELLDATFAAIQKDYGSLDTFYHKALGLSNADIARLRALYLL